MLQQKQRHNNAGAQGSSLVD
jgi:hypothetical protein